MRRAPFSGMKFLGGRLPTVEEAKEILYSFLGSPAWQVLMDVRCLICADRLASCVIRCGRLLSWRMESLEGLSKAFKDLKQERDLVLRS